MSQIQKDKHYIFSATCKIHNIHTCTHIHIKTNMYTYIHTHIHTDDMKVKKELRVEEEV